MYFDHTLERRSYPLLSGAFLIALAAALALAFWAVGVETYPYIVRPIKYRVSLATLDRVYLVALAILGLHYAAYVAHFVLVGSRQRTAGRAPDLVYSPTKFALTWLFLIGLAGAYTLGASIATPALFDSAFGPAHETAFLRVWNHTYFGFLLLVALAGGVVHLAVKGFAERGPGGALARLGEPLSLRGEHRFTGILNWILLLGILANIATGWFILGALPLVGGARLPLHAYGWENWARLAHDSGTAFVIAALSGQIYLRLLPGRQWMLKTMFAGYERAKV